MSEQNNRLFYMKKLYIKPTLELELIEETDILAGSPSVEVKDYDDTKHQYEIPTKPEEGDGTDFAKQSTFIWDDEF